MSALELAAGDVAERSRVFRSRFATGLAIASIFICVANVVGILASGLNRPTALFPAIGTVTSVGAMRLVRDGRTRLGTNILLATDALLLSASAISGGIAELRVMGVQLYMLIVVMGTLFEGLLGGSAFLILCAAGAAIPPILDGQHATLVVVIQTCAMITGWLCGGYAERYFSANERMLADRVEEMAVVVDDAERVAEGELSVGEATSQVIRRMLSGLRTLVERSLESVAALAAATAQVSTMSHRQTTSASAQARAVTDARVTLSALSTATESIANAAQAVLENASAALEAHRAARDHTNALVAREQQVGEFLEMIKDVARRSELLALNAALEGSRAGDAGAAFSLVANEMQQLAENTSDNVTRVKVIVTDIRAATAATAETIGSATALAESTAERARVIERTARAQASATEDVLAAMDGIAALTQGFAEMSDETLTAMTELTTLASDLQRAVATFRL